MKPSVPDNSSGTNACGCGWIPKNALGRKCKPCVRVWQGNLISRKNLTAWQDKPTLTVPSKRSIVFITTAEKEPDLLAIPSSKNVTVQWNTKQAVGNDQKMAIRSPSPMALRQGHSLYFATVKQERRFSGARLTE